MATDFQSIVDGMAAMTCVVSVEELEDGGCGEVRIVTGNRSYIDSIERPTPGAQMLTQKFIPNQEYTRYLTRDLNFEDYCFRSAVHKKCLHSYAHPERMNIWFNMTFLPLDADEGNLHYCTYTMEINEEASSQRLSNVSGSLASLVLEFAIKLRSSNDFDHTMADVVAEVRDKCQAEYACILWVDEQERSCSVLAENFAEGTNLRPADGYLDDGFYEIVATWPQAISGSNCLVAKNAHDMEVVRERSPQWHESLVDASIESIVLFPLKSHGDLLGYIWAVNFDPDKAGEIKEAMELATYVLAAEMDNHQLLKRLKVLGSTDMLTNVMNRNEMNNRVVALSDGEEAATSVGVVFADLNGLKRVNDEEGHTAGDALLKNGVEALSEVFARNAIYRAGGDEFVVIVPDITESELRAKVDAVRETTKRNGKVSFALGCCVAERPEDTRTALRIADERMYQDKEAFYSEKGLAPRHLR